MSNAQDIPLSQGKQYTIGNIEVTGSSTFNTKTIIAYSGLREGQLIYLPGDVISKTIKKLWALGLFKDVNIYITNVENNVADLELNIVQLPLLDNVRIDGVKKVKSEDFIKENKLSKGTKVTENLITTTKNYIRNHYKEKGYLNTKVLSNVTDSKDTVQQNAVNVLFKVDKGERVKINNIVVNGNKKFVDNKVRNQLKKTKKKSPFRFWKRSKYIVEDYKEGKQAIIDKYKEKGYRDARIVSDSIAIVSDELIDIHLNVEEGKRYYFGDISFLGNSVYSDEQLQKKLVLKKGDVYNGVLLEKRIADTEKPDGDDITNLYQNNGYFFSTINPVETNVRNDSIIDFEIRINEGKLAYFNNITVVGNDRTNDHVVYRNIRTNPGDVYSKEKIIRTIRELGQTTFFDTEQLTPNFKNVDQNAGTIDVEYSVVEKGSSQFELQGGYGGTGFIGTLGLSFNNFSVRNIFNKEAYRPLPSGDGQTLSLRAQASQSFRTYYIQFIEPWLGGKKPFQLSTTLRHTQQFNWNFTTGEVDRDQSFLLSGGSVGIAQRLKWPDDYFTLSQTLGFQHYNLQNFALASLNFSNGSANDLSYTFGLVRDNTSVSPIFPTGGSRLAFSVKATLPYTKLGDTDWEELAEERAEAVDDGDADRVSEIDQQRFRWLEYYKVKFSGDWYTSLPKKFVFKSSFQFGFLGAYNQDRGVIPFERFQLGGSGLGVNNGIASIENVALRGYPDAQVVSKSRDLTSEDVTTTSSGSPLYNRFSLELRYPVSFNPTATIYALGFIEAGAAYDSFRQFDPFDLNRSAGAGVRIFMPAFGLLGIDFAYGFDPLSGDTLPNGWEVHFVLGQQF